MKTPGEAVGGGKGSVAVPMPGFDAPIVFSLSGFCRPSMTDTPQIPGRNSTLRLEIDLPDLAPAAALLTAWGFRSLYELEEPEECAVFTDGFFNWVLTRRPAPAQVCLHYLTEDWDAWLATTAADVQHTARTHADPEWGISFEVSERVHVQIQSVAADLEVPPAGFSLLPDGRFAEVGIGTGSLASELARWGQLGFKVLRRSQPDEVPYALLFDGVLVIGLYEQASWNGPSLAFFAEEPAARAQAAHELGLGIEELHDGAWRVWLPGQLSMLWLPEYRRVEPPSDPV